MYVSPSHLSVSFLFCLKNPHSCFTSFYFRSWSSSVLSIHSCSFLHVPSVSMFQKHVTLPCVFGFAGMSCHALSVTNLSRTGLPVPPPSLFLCVRISAAVTTSCTLLHDLCAGYVTYIYRI